jgi:hypothetical protein
LNVNWLKVPIIVLLAGPILALGRWFSWLFLGCHWLRWLANRWFVPPWGGGAIAGQQASSQASSQASAPGQPPGQAAGAAGRV